MAKDSKSVDQQMSGKDRFDAYMKLANYWGNSYQERRAVEWKVGFGLWAVILTAIINKETLPTVASHARMAKKCGAIIRASSSPE